MSIEYDEKGKFYTDVVTKVAVSAMIQTTVHFVRGFVHVRQGERLKDELERNEQFLAVTDAQVEDSHGKVVFTTPFMAIKREQIVWIMPVDTEKGGGE